MPTYEYACRSCNQHIEVVQSFRDDPLQECGHCGGALRKVFSAAGIIFKGSGYYVTDTRAAQASNGAGKSSKSSGEDGSSTGEGSGKEAGDAGSGSEGSDSKGSEGKGSEGKSSEGKSPESKGSEGSARKSA